MSKILMSITELIILLIIDYGFYIAGMIAGANRYKRKLEAEGQEVQRQTAFSPQKDEPHWVAISALGSKHDTDVCGTDYAFGSVEYEERKKIVAFILRKCTQGLYSCELDFPISERSLEWLKYSGFEVSQADDKTQVSWENAET